MIWIEKYKPKTFEAFSSHKEVISTLQSYTLETIPNLIIHGQTGHNKKTTVYSLINHLYGKYPELKQKYIEMDIGTAKLNVGYLESEEVIELCPSEYGIRDRHVSQHIIKEMAQTKPILGMFGSKKRSVKILIIDQAENLSKDAQAALRRTMEIYSNHFRIIMICTEISKLIDPIKSRCLLIRMRGFDIDETKRIFESILQKENIDCNTEIIESICNYSEGNLKKDLSLLELMSFNCSDIQIKKFKTDLKNIKLDWEIKIDQIVDLITNSQKIDNLATIRKNLYDLLNSCIPPNLILVEILRRVNKGSIETMKAMVSFAIIFEERMRLGIKPLYHLEAFIASIMCVLSQKNK